ncbi:uncharacterized protein LOC106657162 isoform X2 [Trichogramma pretiosum]|uniref:uncharacterized protein LOC106657162 isoform X2 n=1 Tax=Trichogramma pretiosum TaxID=7493 RepID=UPI000C71BE97|nr:uncharacterized protein LOC106657162 isoform X2 [Trichogramma pretiosum]
MTVMPSSSDVADKAVSTEDAIASGGGGGGGGGPVEMARLEAVLAALVESKVEAMKHDSALEAAALKAKRRRAGSVPVSPTTGRNRSRLTSSSTLSSDQQQHHHHHHHHHHGKHHHHHRQHHPHGDKRGRRHRHRRHDSAPCGDYIEDPHKHRHGGREKSRSVDSPGRHHNRRRHSRPPHPYPHPHHRPPNPAATLPPAAAHEGRETIVSETRGGGGGDPRFELLGINDADLAAIKLEHLQQSRQALSDTHEYATAARIHQSACYISHSAAQLKSHYDEDDYLTLQYADEIDDDDEDDSLSLDVDLEAARASVVDTEGRAGAANNGERRPPTGRRPPRRKRKRRKRRRTIVDVEGIELEMEDPDDLPPRARWTIVATACLLLVMSLLLVGVTLRMAPIIDEMADGIVHDNLEE